VIPPGGVAEAEIAGQTFDVFDALKGRGGSGGRREQRLALYSQHKKGDVGGGEEEKQLKYLSSITERHEEKLHVHQSAANNLQASREKRKERPHLTAAFSLKEIGGTSENGRGHGNMGW